MYIGYTTFLLLLLFVVLSRVYGFFDRYVDVSIVAAIRSIIVVCIAVYKPLNIMKLRDNVRQFVHYNISNKLMYKCKI